jgi:hypothetical protein
MLIVDAQPVDFGLRHALRGKTAGYRQPAANGRFAFVPQLLHTILTHTKSLLEPNARGRR